MTEERKQELRQLLDKANRSLVIRHGFGGRATVPVDVYREYLKERWTFYGIDFLSFRFPIQFAPDITDQSTKSNFMNYIRVELVQFIDNGPTPDMDCIYTATYIVESDSTYGDRLYSYGRGPFPLFVVLERLLEISLVRGIEEAVSFFDQCSCPEGTHAFFRDVGLLEGAKLEKAVEVFDGVRLVPLPSSKISRQVEQCLFRFPVHSSTDRVDSLFGKTLLVIDRSGFSTICRSSDIPFQDGIRIDDLPFQVKVHDVKFPNVTAVDSFQTLFCQALSLICNSSVKIFIGFYALEEDKSFDLPKGGGGMSRQGKPLGTPTEVKEADIEKAKYLYGRLVDLDSSDREKLHISIDRWVQSKTKRSRVDKIVDLGIAFEALYAPDSSSGEIRFKLAVRGAWNLGENEKHRKMLMKEFQEIYDWRSKIVHTGNLPNKTKNTPFTYEEIKQFIERAQDLCRKSILKVLEDGRFPDWKQLDTRRRGGG